MEKEKDIKILMLLATVTEGLTDLSSLLDEKQASKVSDVVMCWNNLVNDIYRTFNQSELN